MVPDASRKCGSIFHGFGVNPPRWVFLMKRMATLRVFLMGYVSIFHGVLSKLMLVNCIGAGFWTLRGSFKPHDARQNSLID